MRIDKKWLKRRHHTKQLRLPSSVKKHFAKEIADGNIPTQQQIKIAVELGLVKKNVNGKLDSNSLSNYFKIFIKQRQDDEQRKN